MSMIGTFSPASRPSFADLWVMGLADQLSPDHELRPWREWLARHFPHYTTAPFGERHLRFWQWVTDLEPGVRPRPRVEVWPRGGAKSTTIELGCAYLGAGASPRRHYVLYVSETQAQANKHVQAIAAMLERVGIRRALNEYGASKGWRHEEIRTANGFNVTAFGLDAGMRGVKLDEYRPDVIVMDDIDGRHDTPATTQKKIDVITETVLPAGSIDCAVIVIQNKIAADSIVSQLCDGRADFLHDREPAVVEPAVIDLQYDRVIDAEGLPKYQITAGTATWAGQSLATCERQLNDWGVGAFLREAQHDVDDLEGGLWNRARDIDPFRVGDAPLVLDRIVVAIDPNTTGTGDDAGIVVAGIARVAYDRRLGEYVDAPQLHGYILEDATVAGGPKAWAEMAVDAYRRWRADSLIAERNNGGDMVSITIETIPGAPPVTLVWASRGKLTRAEPVQKLYQDGRIHHVDVFDRLEREMCTYVPGNASPNRMDALVWALTDLMLDDGDFSQLDAWNQRLIGGR